MLQIKTFPKLCIPQDTNYVKSDRGGKRLLVILLALLWGMEIGFKFASRTVIYLLNPCHVTTLIQVSISTVISLAKMIEHVQICLPFKYLLKYHKYFMYKHFYYLEIEI